MTSDWAQLAIEIRACTACAELVRGRTNVVVGVPPVSTPLVLIGEAPGAAEDATGLPFVGRAGALLDELLAEAGLARAAVGVLNVLKCRPTGNRAPTTAEITNCRPWLDRQLSLSSVRVIVTLGGTAARWAFGRPTKLADVRGRAHALPGHRDVHVVPSYHPSAALRFGPNGEPRRLLRADLAFAASLLDASSLGASSS